MLPEPGVLALLVLFGAWVGVDSTSVGQFMISRPVVSATLAGWIVGDPAAGALVGLVLEALSITVLPVGAARYPEMGPAGVVAGASFALSPQGGVPLLTVVLFALCWAWIGGLSVRLLRQSNSRVTYDVIAAEDPPAVLERRHIAAIGIDLLRAAGMVAAGFPILAMITVMTLWSWDLPRDAAMITIWGVVGASVAATVVLFGGKRIPHFAAGLFCGVLLLILL
jgi:mannose/fructose/N-acetylgalactosamine-specific phosphotransferase system component IIC